MQCYWCQFCWLNGFNKNKVIINYKTTETYTDDARIIRIHAAIKTTVQNVALLIYNHN